MAEKARHAFGNLENIDTAISAGKIDSYDILFVKDANGKPYVGWIDKEGQKVIVDDSAELAALETQIATKANAKDVEAKIAMKADAAEVDTKIDTASQDTVATAKAYTDEKVEAALAEHPTKMYEITDVPIGTLVDYRDKEIRIMSPANCQWIKQTVGNGGDPNCYYVTFKTYVPNDDVIGYIEHLGDQTDSEILTEFSTDKYGRRYQSTWLAIAKYDEATDTWTYYGAKSTTSKFIGWDYQIDWYGTDNKIIASDRIRINLSNEECHSSIKPYYGVSETEEVDTKIDEAVENAVESANAYTDAQIEAKLAEIEAAASYEIIEF